MRIILIIAAIIFSNMMLLSQDFKEENKEAPKYKMFRAEENYGYLKDKENTPYEKDYLDVLKFIPLNKTKDINLLFGGEIRPRLEHFSNRNWEEEKETFYTQRLSFHTNLNITKYVKVFGEVYHGSVSLEEEEFAQSDQLDLHQGFIELKIPMGTNSNLKFRAGRQELALGSARLLGLREGPNIRRTYDMGRAIFYHKKTKIDVFYGKEVKPSFGLFDNEFNLFSSTSTNAELWGIYSQFSIKNDIGKNELYYLGFHSKSSFYNDASGDDRRHTLGLRRFGKINKAWRYNTEIMVQFGETGGKKVTAWAFETDWHYQFYKKKLEPELGLKLDVISGDSKSGDNTIETFNPMFTNPAYFSLAGTIAPVNLIEFHPSISLKPTEKTKVYIEFASFYRFSISDGVYSPPRFLNREGNTITERFVGNQFGLKLELEIDRHFSFDFDLSYFLAGKFLEQTGGAENILHVAPTLTYKF